MRYNLFPVFCFQASRHIQDPSMLRKFILVLTNPRLFQRIWKRLLFLKQWIILIAPYPSENESPTWENFKPILPPPDRDWADPFLWVHNGKRFIFVEEKPYSTNRGHISCLALDENLNISSSQIILERPYHLSYPFLFEYQGQLYMLPESGANNAIELYKCTDFPSQWEFVKALIPNIQAVDATLVEKDGLWWLFANIVVNSGSSWDSLYLFKADSPLSDQWSPHPKNPIVKDLHTARPAGNFLMHGIDLIRPSQDCSVCYGYAINFNRVTMLDEANYAEIRINTLKPPTNNRSILATHTWNEKQGLVVIDAKILRRRKFPFH
jgi:hypothetical protein